MNIRVLTIVLVSLGSTAVAQHVIWEVEGPLPSSSTSTTLFPIRFHAGEDVNGDKVPDVVASAPFVDSKFKGRTYVFSGIDGSVLLEINGFWDDANLGTTSLLPGDLNGDGLSEFASSTLLGPVEVFSGADGSLLYQIPPPAPWSFETWDPLAILQADGDGIPDLALGCATCSPGPGAAGAGAVAVVSGANGSVIWAHAGNGLYDRLGWSVANVGDVDGDGVDDLLAGAPGMQTLHEVIQFHDSYALLLSGATGDRIARIDHVPPWQPGTVNLRFAWSVAGVDYDRDGVSALVVGQAWHQDWTGPAAVSVYGGANFALIHQSTDDDGTTVRDLGDADGDGFDDYLACYDKAALWVGGMLVGAGKCYVTSGKDHERFLELVRVGSGTFGDYAELLGDVDGDGFPDVAIGDRTYYPGPPKIRGRLTAMSLVPAGVTVLGMGCPGYQGEIPRIGVRGSPVLGQELSIFLSKAAPGVAALLGIGFAELVPPLDLGSFGLPGCMLATPVQTTFSRTTQSQPPAPGRASVDLFVPDDAALVGAQFFAQWWVDGGPGFPAALTRALRFDPFQKGP
jgi:hypothetical protein